MKPKWKTSLPKSSLPILCKVRWEDEIYYISAYHTGKEFINPETRKRILGVMGWDYIEE